MRIGTRGSALALAQASLIAEQLTAAALEVELVPIVTSGDRGEDDRDKSRWVSEIERALALEEIDVAVHSAKDVPAELGDGLRLAGAPARAGAEDALCGAGGLDQLAPGARVGTSSLRRSSQLRAVRPDLCVVALRGNVDTRLRKLEQDDLDAIVLARAGLQRLGREHAIDALLDPAVFVPAPGQGALALELRADDDAANDAIAPLIDADATCCLRAERALAAALEADCDTALGAHATLADGRLLLRVWLGLDEQSGWVGDELYGERSAPEELALAVAERVRLAASAARAQEPPR